MTSEQLRWADDSIVEIKTRVTRCFLGKALQVGRRNNTAAGPSSLIAGDPHLPLCCTRDAVEEYIEPQRKKGTYWQYYDVPVVVIEACGEHRLILVNDQREVDPMSSFSPNLPVTYVFGEVSRVIRSQLPKHVYALTTTYEMEPAEFPFRAYRSNSRPPPRWTPEWWSVDLTGALKQVANIGMWLQEAAKNHD